MFLSAYAENAIFQAALDSGGAAYVLKVLAAQELVPALQAVIASGTYRSPFFDNGSNPQV